MSAAARALLSLSRAEENVAAEADATAAAADDEDVDEADDDAAGNPIAIE